MMKLVIRYVFKAEFMMNYSIILFFGNDVVFFDGNPDLTCVFAALNFNAS